MAEEVRLTGGRGGDGYERVSEWELGLPNIADLTPLSQSLISAEMLSAFSISPEPYRNMYDVNRASQDTLSDIRGDNLNSNSINNNNKGNESVVDLTDSRKLRRLSYDGDGDGGAVEEIDNESGLVTDKATEAAGAASKRQRLVWTAQLHKRFIEVVGHLGVKNAVPKTIMNLMNVEGLSRENVASHLQKYRLYLKRMQGGNSSSSSDHHVIASTNAPPPPQEHQHMQFPASPMVNYRGFEDQQRLIDTPSPRPLSPRPTSPDVEIVQETQPERQPDYEVASSQGRKQKRAHKKKAPAEPRAKTKSISWSKEEEMAFLTTILSMTSRPFKNVRRGETRLRKPRKEGRRVRPAREKGRLGTPRHLIVSR